MKPTQIKIKKVKGSKFTDVTGKSLKPLVEGVLCYAVLIPYKGKGSPKVILHEAKLVEPGGFGYGGDGKHFVLSPRKRK
jgi:hypothetical protein